MIDKITGKSVSSGRMGILAILIFIMPICGFSIDVYAPFLPTITHLFKTTDFMGKCSISIYILGFGLGQVLFGYLSDKLGRKKTLIASLILFGLVSFFITFATSIHHFILLRLAQGIAVAGLVINIRSIVVDLFDGVELRKALIYITTAWMVSPIIGPAVGGYLYVHFDWSASFYFLFIYACVALVLTGLFIPETNQNQRHHSFKTTISHYKTVLRSTPFMNNAYGLMIGFSIINLFSVLGPYLIVDQLGHSPVFYAHVALLVGTACFLGSLFNSLLVRTLSTDNVIKIASISLLFIGLMGVILTIYYKDSVSIMIVCCVLVMFLIGIIYPNYSANCSGLFRYIAGTAAAVRGIITMVGASIITGIISLQQINSIAAFLTIYPVLTAISLLFFLKKSNAPYYPEGRDGSPCSDTISR